MSARHHIVPQFYLRRFANESDQVALVDRDTPSRVHRNHVRRACSEVGFYRIETNSLEREEDRASHDPEIVEQIFGQFETAAAPAIHKILAGQRDLSKVDQFHLINFIALQTVRGARWREDFNAVATHAMRRYVAETLTDKEIRGWLVDERRRSRNVDIATYRRELLSDGPRLEAPSEVMIQEGFKMALSDVGGIAEQLVDRMCDWDFIEPRTTAVLTSDEPVCWWAPGDEPFGYGNAKIVWLPLSRGVVLQMRQAGESNESLGLPALDSIEGHNELALIVNREVASQAQRWIVHHPDDRPLDDLEILPRTQWVNERVGVSHEGNFVREQYVHRRRPLGQK